MWSKGSGHLPIICIIWIYYLNMDLNDVQITYRTLWLKIDVWIIPTLYIVALDYTSNIVVGSALKIGAECIYICTNSPKLPNCVTKYSMILTIKHPDPHIPLIPTRLIQWFWLFQLFWLLNIQFQSAQSDDSDCWISQSTYSNHSDLLHLIIPTIEYLIGYLPEPYIFQMNIWSVICLTSTYADWISSH